MYRKRDACDVTRGINNRRIHINNHGGLRSLNGTAEWCLRRVVVPALLY
jgi:hypothetical protein